MTDHDATEARATLSYKWMGNFCRRNDVLSPCIIMRSLFDNARELIVIEFEYDGRKGGN